MKFKRRFFFKLALFLCLVNDTSLIAQRRFQYGINGHPLTQESYKDNLNLQIRMLKRLGVRFYRIDVPISASGVVIEHDKFLNVIQSMRKNGITVLPVLVFDQQNYMSRSPEQAFTDGLTYGRAFSQRYKAYFNYYEVGNEEDNQAILGPHVHGNEIAHYDTPKGKNVVPYIKGICQGIKQQDKTAKTIVNINWVHYGFLQLLENADVKFDRVGYHWYSDMGNMQTSGAGFGNVIDTVYKRFKKPIWLTEINVRGGVPMVADVTKENWLRANLSFLRKNKHVEAVFIYELLDQPAFAEARARASYNVSESAYGLGGWQRKYSEAKEKPLFRLYKSFIQQNP